jgi:hypothetical protein
MTGRSGGGLGWLVILGALAAVGLVLAVALAPYAARILAGWQQVAP